MKRILIVLSAAVSVLAGCAKSSDLEELKKSVDDLEGVRIISVEGQITNINSSIQALQAAKDILDKKVEELGGEDKALKAEAQKLGEDIAKLKEYADGLAAGTASWAEKTFSTIDQMVELQTRLEVLEKLVPELKTALSDLETDIKKWVGIELEGYTTIAALEAAVETSESKMEGKVNDAVKQLGDKIAAQGEEIASLKTALDKDVEGLKKDIADLRKQLTEDYQAAIKEAIDEYAGKVTAEISAKLSEALKPLEAKIGALEEKVTALEGKVSTLEEKVSTLEEQMKAVETQVAEALERIQSVAVVPDYSDGSVDIYATRSSTMRFEINPVSAAKALVETEGAEDYFSFQAVQVKTKADAFIDFTIESVSMDDSGTFVEVVLAPNDAITAGVSLMARLKIEANEGQGDYVCKTSSYFAVNSSKIPQTPSFAQSTISWAIDDDHKIESSYNTQSVDDAKTTVTYYSSNPSVAVINNGKIVIKASGTTTITAAAQESAEYLAGSASYELIIYPEGTLTGVFSVSATKKVLFARGNLYYTGSKWALEANQYDYRTWPEKNACIAGKLTDNGTPADNVGLFFWTSELAKSFTKTYSVTGAGGGDTFFPNTEASVIGSQWYVLTRDEWMYLSNSRTDAANKLGYAKVCGVKGIIILPDTFIDPMKNGGDAPFVPKSSIGYDVNLYDVDNWKPMQAAGAVFLPATGYRLEDEMYQANSQAHYWSATVRDENDAFCVHIGGNDISPENMVDRSCGLTIRLVMTVE